MFCFGIRELIYCATSVLCCFSVFDFYFFIRMDAAAAGHCSLVFVEESKLHCCWWRGYLTLSDTLIFCLHWFTALHFTWYYRRMPLACTDG